MLIYLSGNSPIEKAIIYASLSFLEVINAEVLLDDSELNLKVNDIKKFGNAIIHNSPLYTYNRFDTEDEKAKYLKQVKNLIKRGHIIIYDFPSVYQGTTEFTNETERLKELGVEVNPIEIDSSLDAEFVQNNAVMIIGNMFGDILAGYDIVIDIPGSDKPEESDESDESQSE